MRFFCLVISFIFVTPVFAFQVKPMVAELESIGNLSQKTIRISNPSANSLTIDISVFDLLIAPHGKEELRPNDDDFLIIPMTTIIPPGKSQSVIVRYIGKPNLDESRSYRIAVEQVPVELNEVKESGVGMSLSFRTLFNVVPKGARAELLIKQKTQNDNTWDVLLENKGNKYIRLSQAQWVFKSKEKELVLEGQALSEALTGKILLPHSTRNVSIKVPNSFSADNSELEVIF